MNDLVDMSGKIKCLQEMAALAVFMQGNASQRQYPTHYMTTAIDTYSQTCRSVFSTPIIPGVISVLFLLANFEQHSAKSFEKITCTY